ncbi:MAG: NFACT family protein, partial [Planctomycetota bacterium]|nr:NFACT family protein [Planctomycetota bacterium]
MNFGAPELKAVLDECCGALDGARLKNIYDEGARGWILKFYSSGQTLFLHLGAQPRFSRLHLQPARSSTAEGPGDFCRALRSQLEGAVLEGIRQVNGDRIAELSFSTAGGRLQLVQELFGARPEILLLD